MKHIIFQNRLLTGFFLILLSGCMKNPTPKSEQPVRVVSLAPALTEIICAIGATNYLVGRTSACTWPPERVKDITVIGDFGKPSLEALMMVYPTLELDTGLANKSLPRKFARMGIQHEEIACKTVTDIPAAIRRIGRLLDHSESANKLASDIESRLQAMDRQALACTNPPTVYIELWGDPLMTAGRDTFLSEMIRLAGGKNLGDAAKSGYFKVSSEWVVSRNPDMVICTYKIPEKNPSAWVGTRIGWSNLRAVRNGAVYRIPNPDVVLRPGPRILQGIEDLQKCIQSHSGTNQTAALKN